MSLSAGGFYIYLLLFFSCFSFFIFVIMLNWIIFILSPIWLFVIYRIINRLIRSPRVGYTGKYVLITGCDTGFGHLSAKQLDRLGCHVFAGCLSEKGEDELRKVCSNRLQTVRLDVSSPESIRQAYQVVKSKLPPGKGNGITRESENNSGL